MLTSFASIRVMNLDAYTKIHGQTGAARLLGVSQGLVWQWLHGETKITAERAIDIETKTAGEITRQELRPDLFGEVAA